MDTTNLKALVNSSNKTQKEIARDLNFSRQRLNYYVNGQREPDFETAIRIAEYFHVSLDYLAGKEEAAPAREAENAFRARLREPRETVAPAPGSLTAEEASLLRNFRELNEEGREKMLDYSDDLVQSRKYKNADAAFMGAEAASA